ncbi:MAG: leucine-rich repeat domain-containing protein [Bacteroidaceae bacterium]|nr:leucine-rich repeat domain-containing protein [Bacteroidaceae bacterium]
MKRLQIFVATLLLAGVALPALAQITGYDEEALIAAGYQTGDDLVTSWFNRNNITHNGGSKDSNGSNKYCGDIVVPEGKTSLQQGYGSDFSSVGTFQYSYITTATLPSTLTSIGNASFADCIYLQNIYVDDENEKYFDHDGVVYERLSSGGYKLVAVPGAKTNVTILEGTTQIGASAFDGCSNIMAVVIPATVTSIDQYAFTDTKLSSLTLLGTTPPTVNGGNTSHGLYDMGLVNANGTPIRIQVPAGTKATYLAANRWSDLEPYIIEFELPNTGGGEENEEGTTSYVPHIEKIFLYDSENYTRTEEHEVGSEIRRTTTQDGKNTIIDIYYSSAVTYERTFYNNNWQALYAPFIIKYGDYRTDMLEVAEIKSVTEYLDADNNITWFYLTAEVLDPGDEIPAHTPCVVRTISVNDAGVGRDIDLFKGVDSGNSARILEPAETKTMVLTSSNGNQYNLVGQYTRRNTATIQAEDGVDYKEIYAMAGGTLKKAGGANVTLGAYRWYLSIEPAAGNSTMMFKFGNFNQGNATSVDEIVVDSDADRSDNIYYDLSGRAVDNPVKGIYIYNGKKVYLDR